jgi:hypothetical protein
METLQEKSKQQTTENLMQYYSNAKNTYMQCGGHFKAEKNHFFMDTYADELLSRGINVENVELPEGIFNGDGSY